MTTALLDNPTRASLARLDPEPLIRRAREMLQAGRVAAARPMLAALRRIAGAGAEITELQARLLMQEGRLDDGLRELDAGLAEWPEAAALHLCRAELHMLAGNHGQAAIDAADAVMLEPSRAPAKAMLGIALIELNRFADAIACLAEAVAANPNSPPYCRALSEAQQRLGDHEAAGRTLRVGIASMPDSAMLRTAGIMECMRRRAFDEAILQAQAACRDGVADACVFGLLGHGLSKLGRHDESASAYAEALKLAPEDPYVRHLVQAAGILPESRRAPAPYLEIVFDGYAARFEQHIIGLGYRAPGLIRAALIEHLALLQRPTAAPVGPVLDLGCGTGLMGVVLSDLPLGPLVGVDLSSAMLREAAAKGLYAELCHADLETVLAADGRPWPVILAADVLCYFGDLDAVLGAVWERLQPGGLFVFTVETPHDDHAAPGQDDTQGRGWRLCSQGRYIHRTDYVCAAAERAGLELREARPEALRTEAGAPVSGTVFVLRRPEAGQP